MLRGCQLASIVAGVALACLATQAWGGSATEWYGTLSAEEGYQSAVHFGAWPGYQDGYDGQTPQDIAAPGVYIFLYRANGAYWAGPTGFYATDLESAIPAGGSKTWSQIRLWSYNYTPRLGDRVGTSYVWVERAPTTYWGQLVLDHVPAGLNWTGDTEWFFPLWQTAGYNVPALPCPILTDPNDPYNPDNVTRMHLTVYTYPVPEPCSLAALGLALAGAGIGVVRRRR